MITFDKNNKLAFSLFETLVVMGIVAIFVTASANVFTKKRKPVSEKASHGRFECYYNSGTLTQQYFIENMPRTAETVSICRFKPIKNAQYYIINLVGGGGAGSSSSSGYGGNAGEYHSFFVTDIGKELQITPGKGAAVGGSSTSSTVDTVDSSGTKTIAEVLGGGYGFDKSTMDGSHVLNCTVTSAKYTCSRQPYCKAYTDSLQVSYCAMDDIAGTEPDAYVTEQLLFNGDYGINKTSTMSGTLVNYSDAAGNYELSMMVDTNMTTAADVSQFTNYLQAIGIDTDIVTAAPGNGGAQGQPGNDGAAVIIW